MKRVPLRTCSACSPEGRPDVDAFAQSRFAAALLDPAIDPTPLLDRARRDGSAARRFGVHRNTVATTLARALAEGFPSVERLGGGAFFAAMAIEHVRRCPPRHPVLLAYGADFPTFIEGFEPVAHLPYLADVARLDGLRRRAWHAPDVPALDAPTLAALRVGEAAALRVGRHPSAAMLRSPHPARSIWAAQNGDPTPMPAGWPAQTSLVVREDGRVRVEAVDAALADLLDAARAAPTLGELLDGADTRTTAAFATALQRGLLVDADALAKARANTVDDGLFDGFLPPTPPARSPR